MCGNRWHRAGGGGPFLAGAPIEPGWTVAAPVTAIAARVDPIGRELSSGRHGPLVDQANRCLVMAFRPSAWWSVIRGWGWCPGAMIHWMIPTSRSETHCPLFTDGRRRFEPEAFRRLAQLHLHAGHTDPLTQHVLVAPSILRWGWSAVLKMKCPFLSRRGSDPPPVRGQAAQPCRGGRRCRAFSAPLRGAYHGRKRAASIATLPPPTNGDSTMSTLSVMGVRENQPCKPFIQVHTSDARVRYYRLRGVYTPSRLVARNCP